MRLQDVVRKVLIGAALIAVIAGILLYSDRQQRNRDRSGATDVNRMYRIGIAYFAPEEGVDLCIKGLLDGLAEQGLVEGRNLVVLKAHAQAEISNIPTVLQNFDSQDLDLIIPLSTPCLAAACSVVKRKPVTFSYVYDPIAGGAGKSFTDHVPHVTGVGSFPDVAGTFEVIRQLVPGVKRIGTLYNSSEMNSVKVISVGRETCKKMGLTLEEVAITGTSEVHQAAQVLVTRDIQALWVTGDNTALQAMAAIGKVAADSRIPLIINDPEFVDKGALVAVGIGWHSSGYEAGKIAGRVLRGEQPRDIPFVNVAERKLVLNQAVAQKLGISLPAALREHAGL